MKISTQLVFSVDPEFKEEFEKEAEKLRVETKSKRGCQKKLLLQMFKTWLTVTAEEEKRKKRKVLQSDVERLSPKDTPTDQPRPKMQPEPLAPNERGL